MAALPPPPDDLERFAHILRAPAQGPNVAEHGGNVDPSLLLVDDLDIVGTSLANSDGSQNAVILGFVGTRNGDGQRGIHRVAIPWARFGVFADDMLGAFDTIKEALEALSAPPAADSPESAPGPVSGDA